ncbi:MAG: hypothetical protein WCK33_10335 [Phycisphaerae bacterium]|jgi:hypothetical protein
MSAIGNVRPVRVDGSADTRRATSLRLAIAVSRRALVAATAQGRASALFETAPSLAADGPDVHLCFVVDHAGDRVDASVRCELVDASSGDRWPLTTSGRAAIVNDDDLLHVDAPGLLSATLRRADLAGRPLFLRTPLLGAMGLAGGRYEVP